MGRKKSKVLHLLRPDLQTGYLNYGKGQEVTYLNVPKNLTKGHLAEDVEHGAVMFKELSEFAKKKPSDFVIINCHNEEEGMMAVAYLAAIYNRADKEVFPYPEDILLSEEYSETEEDSSLSDENTTCFRDYMADEAFSRESFSDEAFTNEPFSEDPFSELPFTDSPGENCEDYDETEGDCWVETPWKIPIIRSDQLMQGEGNQFNPFGYGNVGFGGIGSPRNRIPFWYNTRTESICILHNPLQSFFTSLCSISQKLKRYKNNRHVFLVMVSDQNQNRVEFDFSEESSAICEVILDYNAGAVDVVSCPEERKEYQVTLFENWVREKGLVLAGGFPVKKVVASISAMNQPDKSALLEKVINYAIKNKNDEATKLLCEKDFVILDHFKRLGAREVSEEEKSAKKLQKELVGMQAVKEQIQGIVAVMKYNKRRMEMGIGGGSYHNVHMLLGAPGTAKTTVAQLLGNMMAEENLLSGNRFISVNGAELKGMYVGHSAPKVKALFDEYNIIFIDEAYAIAAEDGGGLDSFSQEAIAQLIIELEKHGMDRLVMFAGYGGKNVSEKDNKMKKFLQANPGIRSRINSTIYFDSYTPVEMVEIFRNHAKLNHFTLQKGFEKMVEAYFAERVRMEDFGNGREARSLLENSIVQAAKRLSLVEESNITERMMKELRLEDVQQAIAHQREGMKMQLGREGSRLGF